MPAVKLHREDIRVEIDKTLQSLDIEAHTAASIRIILHTNLDRGRAENFIGNDIRRVGDYVRRVLEHYGRLHSHIQSVQKARTDEVWQPLFKQLQAWAYSFLLRKGFVPGPSTRAIAEECATEAAIRILDAHFPYDTDFDPWAHTTVIMTCFRFFRDGTKKSTIPPNNLVELDEQLPNLEDSDFKNQDDRNVLLQAMLGLSEARRQVIHLHYLDDVPLTEIATLMGKSAGAIHSLHFNALQDLRKILSKNRDNT
ncbi:MAG: sigma-70 family RNA polymerase sigma factor [Bacteroidetes bacterium]|nr:sigma-70 family RNA polymerase sigma factor [Bacteroidota bacterium]